LEVKIEESSQHHTENDTKEVREIWPLQTTPASPNQGQTNPALGSLKYHDPLHILNVYIANSIGDSPYRRISEDCYF
jgi:hypothetical protein